MFSRGSPPPEEGGAGGRKELAGEQDHLSCSDIPGVVRTSQCPSVSPNDHGAMRQLCGGRGPSVRLSSDDVGDVCKGDRKPFKGVQTPCFSRSSLEASTTKLAREVERGLPLQRKESEEEPEQRREIPAPPPPSFLSCAAPFPPASQVGGRSDSLQKASRVSASTRSFEEEAPRPASEVVCSEDMWLPERDTGRAAPPSFARDHQTLPSESLQGGDSQLHAHTRRDGGKGSHGASISRIDSLVAGMNEEEWTGVTFHVDDAQKRNPCFLLQGLVDALAPREQQISVHVAEQIPALESVTLRFATNRAKLRFSELFLRGLKARKQSSSWSFLIPGVINPQTGFILASGSPFHWPLGLAGAIVEAEERAERAAAFHACQHHPPRHACASLSSPVSSAGERGEGGDTPEGRSPPSAVAHRTSSPGTGGNSRNTVECKCLCHGAERRCGNQDTTPRQSSSCGAKGAGGYGAETQTANANGESSARSLVSCSPSYLTGSCRNVATKPMEAFSPCADASPSGPRPALCPCGHSDASFASRPFAGSASSPWSALVSPVGCSHADPGSDFALISFVFSSGPKDSGPSPRSETAQDGQRRCMHRGSDTPSCVSSTWSHTSNSVEDASAEEAFPLDSRDQVVSTPSQTGAKNSPCGVPGGPWLAPRRRRRDRDEERRGARAAAGQPEEAKAEGSPAAQGDAAPHEAVSAERVNGAGESGRDNGEKSARERPGRNGRTRRKTKPPITIKSYVVSSDTWQLGCIEYGSHCMPGQRAYNEDRVCVVPAVDVCTREGCCKAHTKAMFYAVYDGHNGEEAVNYVQEHLHKNIFRSRAFHGDVSKAIRAGFLATDNALRAMVMEKIRGEGYDDQDISPFSSGTTACTAVVRDMQLYIGNLGDSRCVVSRAGRSHLITVDHSCRTNADEQQRVREDGGHYDTDGYLNGAIGVSRAFGAFDKNCGQKLSGLTCEPQIHKETLRREDEFMIIACDGVFDVISCQEAVNCVRKHLRGGGTAETAAQTLCKFAFERRSLDNLSAVIAVFQSPERLQNKDKKPDGSPTAADAASKENSAAAGASPGSARPPSGAPVGASAGDRTGGVSGGASAAAGGSADGACAPGEGPPRRRINFAALKGLL
ncbi:hypothetical protein NCLIV_048310 [Neospora caninum Liverpool]|uniref:Probable protein phosphatase 2C 47 n=1 Tax=Neospora caninum (strain Liverpool) TaxID=572307 RepID=F0VMC4_NEOCL|nr:hypothetical protein NCLIV_048310 [Neospora caninum Liverpool]CBZ54402.1 hypothetical protein NCLIV_048310 [Neospora caninum Liverpool]CEL69109.1 TPA: Probable protein phosphatase 2C 47 [Neospora caninum Liverpool]|eukprot:XP_003884432.1 hypothetical protein NCLIV_048310 [Neospora caninum Liverpool]